MKDITEILRHLGMLESETQTYLAALEHGPQTVIGLSDNTGLSRQATYVAIETLTKRGLISSLQRGKRRLFAAEPPAKLLAYAKRKDREMHDRVQDLETALPELELRVGGEKPTVRLYEGREGMMALTEELKQSKVKEISEISDLAALYQVMPEEEMQRFRREMRKLGLQKVEGLYAGAPAPKVGETDRIHLPESMGGFKSDIGVFGDKISLLTFAGKMQTIIIESPRLAKTMRLLFKLARIGARTQGLKSS